MQFSFQNFVDLGRIIYNYYDSLQAIMKDIHHIKLKIRSKIYTNEQQEFDQFL